ncbi:MAG: hypothetical protein WC456_04235 [Patescibacteria group bacterium]
MFIEDKQQTQGSGKGVLNWAPGWHITVASCDLANLVGQKIKALEFVKDFQPRDGAEVTFKAVPGTYKQSFHFRSEAVKTYAAHQVVAENLTPLIVMRDNLVIQKKELEEKISELDSRIKNWYPRV